MWAVAIRRYLLALLLYVQRRLEGGRGAVVAVRTRDTCGVDRRCCMAVHMLMTSLVENSPVQRLKRGTYLIERAAVSDSKSQMLCGSWLRSTMWGCGTSA